MKALLSLTDLHISINSQEIVRGINLEIMPGTIHVIMGPNGSGKSTLSYALMGHPSYTITQGIALFHGHDLGDIPVHERARKGLFLGFQYPFEIEGVPVRDFLRQAYNARYGGTEKQLSIKEFRQLLEKNMDLLGIPAEFADRSLNVGFSGGEKKRMEMLQLALLQPSLAILDEIDSGLDIDALKTVCRGIQTCKEHNRDMSLLIITHYQRILRYLEPDAVHIMQEGRIISSGGKELAQRLDEVGYQGLYEKGIDGR